MGSDVKQKPGGIPDASGDTNSLLRNRGRSVSNWPSWIPIDFKEDAGVNLPRIPSVRRLFHPRGAFHARASTHPTRGILLTKTVKATHAGTYSWKVPMPQGG